MSYSKESITEALEIAGRIHNICVSFILSCDEDGHPYIYNICSDGESIYVEYMNHIKKYRDDWDEFYDCQRSFRYEDIHQALLSESKKKEIEQRLEKESNEERRRQADERERKRQEAEAKKLIEKEIKELARLKEKYE